MAKCSRCDKEAVPGSNFCPNHDLDGRDVLYIHQDTDVDPKDSV
jgi:hypothetical protein